MSALQEYVIIYPNTETGGVIIVSPAPDCGLSLEAIALKDVPPGVPYKYVHRNNLPSQSDFVFFDAFEADFSNPDGNGADYGFGSTNEVVGWSNGFPVLKGPT